MIRYAAAAVLVVIAVGFGAVYFLYWPKPSVPDHLCGDVSDTLHLKCVDVLQAEDAMHPGAVVVYRAPVEKGEHGRAEIPSLDLLNESC